MSTAETAKAKPAAEKLPAREWGAKLDVSMPEHAAAMVQGDWHTDPNVSITEAQYRAALTAYLEGAA